MINTHRYFLGNDEDQEGWNLVILDQEGKECTLFASGDYGKYAARFYFEKDFREAFLKLGKEYLLRNIARDDIYDGNKTKDRIKRNILRARYDDRLNREEARQEWDLIEDYDIDHEVGFDYWLRETKIDWEIATEFMSYRYPVGAVAFVEQTLPRLKQLISQELENDRPSNFISRTVGSLKNIIKKVLRREVA